MTFAKPTRGRIQVVDSRPRTIEKALRGSQYRKNIASRGKVGNALCENDKRRPSFGVNYQNLLKGPAGSPCMGALNDKSPQPFERDVYSRSQPRPFLYPNMPEFFIPQEAKYSYVPPSLRDFEGKPRSDLGGSELCCDPPKVLPVGHEKQLKLGEPGAEFGFHERWTVTNKAFTWPALPKDCRRNHPLWTYQTGLTMQYIKQPPTVAASDDY